MEIILNANNFNEEVLRSKIPILVDFWAQWCGPCHIIAPMLSELAKEYEGRLSIGKLNVDENQEISSKFQIRSIPNLKLFKNGQVVEEIVGVQPKNEILKQLQKYLN